MGHKLISLALQFLCIGTVSHGWHVLHFVYGMPFVLWRNSLYY